MCSHCSNVACYPACTKRTLPPMHTHADTHKSGHQPRHDLPPPKSARMGRSACTYTHTYTYTDVHAHYHAPTRPQVGADPAMTSIYLHESVAKCMAWGLFRGGMLATSVVDGTVPNLHLITDLLAMLIPELPKVGAQFSSSSCAVLCFSPPTCGCAYT